MKKGKRVLRCYRCNEAIYFDLADKTDTGVLIPHNEKDGLRHDCPKSPYHLKRSKEVVDAN